MHILVTNDDGPPSFHSSPYVLGLVRELQKVGHIVSVCLPDAQRSWIGKAHIIGQTVKPLYYRPPPPPITTLDEDAQQGTIHQRPSPSADVEEWVLVDGTPASCVQIGLYHFFNQENPSTTKTDQPDDTSVIATATNQAALGGKKLPPIDLVLSGPNYGRNTSSVFALSSGTLGGALEAAICRKRAIALSFAFFSRNHDPVVVSAACRHSVRVVEALYKQWPEDSSVDLYSVNVPLVEGVESRNTMWTCILQNYWNRGGCFMEVEGSIGDGAEEEERIREGPDGEVEGGMMEGNSRGGDDGGGGHRHRHFKWAPRFGDVYKSVDMAGPGNDGWVIKQGQTSVTPLKANFCQAAQHLHNQELELEAKPPQNVSQGKRLLLDEQTLSKQFDSITTQDISTTMAAPSTHHLYAIIDYQDDYVQPLIMEALRAVLPTKQQQQLTLIPLSVIWDANDPKSEPSLLRAIPDYIPITASSQGTGGDGPHVLQITPYEAIDFGHSLALAQPGSRAAGGSEGVGGIYIVNSYMIRKALIRKHHLARTVASWVAKRPASILATHVRPTEGFELDYAEFLDDALVECWDLRASFERNERQKMVSEGGTREGDESPSPQEQNEQFRVLLSPEEREWWILKPSMSDRGQGIKLFSTTQELQMIFDEWEAGASGSDSGGEEQDDDEEQEQEYDADHDDNITAAHLRHFVAQPYIHPPFLMPGDSRKFHIRTYVLCLGALKVYVYKPMLVLFAAKPYLPPWQCVASKGDDGVVVEGGDIENFLTNTCLQQASKDDKEKMKLVESFWSCSIPTQQKEEIFADICAVTGEVFEAGAREAIMHFRPTEGAFELFGLDFLVDQAGVACLLEINAFPDFKQTGDRLDWLVKGLWKAVLSLVLGPIVDGLEERVEGVDEDLSLICVKQVDLGRK